ncbi:hypothetical protein HY491_00820 [Candidatus Woesearchaeota archaeon]|nr:hypothetical protein [Candidatus Woesearchaeota archaeon]
MDTSKKLGSLLIGFSLLLLIILVIVKVKVDSQETFLCKLVEDDPAISMEQCPAHQSGTSWYLTVAFGVAFVILGSGIYLLAYPRGKEKRAFKAVDAGKLDDDEKKVYDMLKQHQGSCYQSDLIKETGLSKVKITRILDKMASKDILERNRRGMTNIIVLR